MEPKRLNYLTVQDILWVNLQVTQKVQRFRYEELEEATFYQYGYGSRADLLAQAAKLIGGVPARAPFPEGNEATAFIALVSFLSINGRRCILQDEEGAEWMSGSKGR